MCNFTGILSAATGLSFDRWVEGPVAGRGKALFTLTWHPEYGNPGNYGDAESWEFHAWVDEQRRFHHEDGKAVLIDCESCSLHYLHGVRVRPSDVHDPASVTSERIRNEPNAEVRRVLRERYGERRYLADTGARLVDVDTTPVDATVTGGPCITRALLEDPEGDRYLVASDGSTARVYHMRVPPGTPTCRAAYEALCGRSGARTLVEA